MMNATIIKREEITKDLIKLFVKPDGGVPDFKPGQYVALGLPGSAYRAPYFPKEVTQQSPDKIIKRAYSIGSPPTEKGYIEFYIATLPQGALTARLVMLKEGDRLFMAPKITGTFTTDDVPSDHNLIFVSTGTGIAPFMSMLRSEGIWGNGRKITLINGVRYPNDLAYKEDLTALANVNEKFSYHYIVSRADPEWSGRKGYVHAFFKDGTIPLDPSVDHVFACGNPAMIEELETMLLERGFKEHSKKHPGNLHIEKYW